MCHSFCAPALHALYEAPPITSALKGHELVQLLSQPRQAHEFNYATKIRSLQIEVNAVAHSAPNLGPFDIASLVPRTPQLRNIDIWNRDDSPSSTIYGQPSSRWYYSTALFDSLKAHNVALRSWHWNMKFLRPEVFETMFKDAAPTLAVHYSSPVFSRLRQLKLTRFPASAFMFASGLEEPAYYDSKWPQFVSKIMSAEVDGLFDAKVRPVASGKHHADAISLLQELGELTFDLCAVNTVWMQYLNVPLRSLKLFDCHEVDSLGFETYLSRQGHQLRELVLDHNLALSLSFLAHLKSSCPKLEILKMDLTYRSSLIASNYDGEPEYIDLITEEEKPTWPTTLHTIELLHLRRWTRSAAELFLASIIEAAPDLPNLRRLVLSCSISISWRERAAFRDSWISRFQRVFLRKASPPSPNLASLRAWREYKQRRSEDAADFASGVRRLSHIAITPRKRARPASTPAQNHASLSSDSDSSDQPRRRRKKRAVQAEGSDSSTRQLRPRRAARGGSGRNGDDASEPGQGSSLRDMVMQAMETHVQGMCDVVDIRIDNLRPRENQLTEGDFLDEEPSGDEDWNEDNDDVEDAGNGYAW